MQKNRFMPRLVWVWVLSLLWLGSWDEPCRAAQDSVMRILLTKSAPTLKLLCPYGGDLVDRSGKRLRALKAGEMVVWTPMTPAPQDNKGKKNQKKPRRTNTVLDGKTVLVRARNEVLEVNGVRYRGTLQVSFGKTGAGIVNLVRLEDYVKGVVGSEIGSLSPPETLKAQAVIARTYGLANRGKHGADGADLCNREHCQVYGGIKAERPSINAAVDATRGIVMVADGVPVTSMYHATCGGMTSNNEDVYGGKPVSYLRRVTCSHCSAGTNFRWTRRIPLDVLRGRLASEKIVFSRLLGVKVESPAPLDRVSKVWLDTERGLLAIKGTTWRKIFELPSTTFVVPHSGNPLQTVLARQPEHIPPSSPGGSPAAGRGVEIRTLANRTGLLVVQGSGGVMRAKIPSSGWQVVAFVAKATPPAPPHRGEAVVREKAQTAPGPRVISASANIRGSPSRSTRPISTSALDGKGPGGVPLRKEAGLQEIVLTGRGYGHQIGLCQAGAIALGRKGWSYRQILPFYYSRVALRIMKP